MRSTFIALLAASALIFLACSDDTTPVTKDTGAKDGMVKADAGNDGAPPNKDGSADTNKPADDAAAKQKVENYVPKDNAITGWVDDPNIGKAGIESAYTDKAIEDIINGHHAPYAAEGTAGFAKQDYVNGKMILTLEIWEMKTTASAKTMFDRNKKDDETNAGVTFETQTNVKTAGIISKTYDAGWTSYGHKGPYVWLLKSQTTETSKEAPLKAETTKFAEALSTNLP